MGGCLEGEFDVEVIIHSFVTQIRVVLRMRIIRIQYAPLSSVFLKYGPINTLVRHDHAHFSFVRCKTSKVHPTVHHQGSNPRPLTAGTES